MVKKIKRKSVNYFREASSYVYNSKNYIFFVAGLFLFFLLIALLLPAPEILAEQIKQLITQLAEKTLGLNTLEMILFILQNNILVSLIGLLFGFILGIVPFILAISNGYVLGYVFKLVISVDGASSLWKILLYGIFEIPAVFISLGLGIKLGTSLFAKNSVEEFFRRLVLSLKVFVFVVVPLLIIAAVIEGILIGVVG